MRMHRIEDAARLAMGNLADCDGPRAPEVSSRPILPVLGQAAGLAALFILMWLAS